jgi:F-type H+-transporting ATPase subunit delta
MKGPTTAARRYAEAVFQIATRDKTTSDWQERLDQLAGVLADERIERLASNAAVPQEEREETLRKALAWEPSDPAFSLLRLLLRRGRVRLADRIAGNFRRLVQRSEGIVPAAVTSATELSGAEEAAIRERLEGMVGQKVEMSVHVDADLIGGVAVRIGDRMIDASVRGRLERLRERLVAGAAG